MHWTHSRYAKADIENQGSDHYIHRVAREKDIMDTAQLILEYLERGGCINVLKSRPPKYRPQRYMPVASKRQTYSQTPVRPAGYRGVDYESVGNSASSYSTKYVLNKEIA